MENLTEQEVIDCKEMIKQWNVRRITFHYLFKRKKVIYFTIIIFLTIWNHIGPQAFKYLIANISMLLA